MSPARLAEGAPAAAPGGQRADGPADDTEALDVFSSPLGGMRLIEASAGTGKTWNICGLYLRLLLERRLTVQQILVVTFTKAATAELRERIRQRIVDVLAGLRAPDDDGGQACGGDGRRAPGDHGRRAPGDHGRRAPGGDDGTQAPPADSAPADPFVADLLSRLRDDLGLADADAVLALQQALQTFDEAAIFTIHGFCQRALADTPFAARLPLVQELLHDDRALPLEAVHDFWRTEVAGAQADPALVAHLLACGDSPAHYARLLQRQLGRPLARLVWPAGIDQPVAPGATAAALVTAFDQARGLWQAGPDAIADTLLSGLGRLHGATYRKDAVRTAQAGWAAVLSAPLAPTAPDAWPPKLALFSSSMLASRAKKDQAPPAHAFFDAAQALLDAGADQQTQLALARLRLLRRLLTDGAAQLRQAKRSRRVVAFDDMLFNLHQRLTDEHGTVLAAALLKRFPAALIDEFQDTDPLQFAVFQAIYGAVDVDAPGRIGEADGDAADDRIDGAIGDNDAGSAADAAAGSAADAAAGSAAGAAADPAHPSDATHSFGGTGAAGGGSGRRVSARGATADTSAPPLCLVGDPKQAIYSFRHADLHTYLRARALASARYTLLANQRSIQPLITALNQLFGLNPRAFVQPGLVYHAVGKGARPQPVLRDATEPRAALQVWTLPTDARHGQPLPKADALVASAAVCGGEIARLLSAAAAGAVTLGERPLRAGDIAVLVRTHAQGSAVRQVLAGLGVGSVELSQASVFSSPDAEELERVLAAVLEPARESLLKAALATRWMGHDAVQIDALADDEPALSALLQRFVQYQGLWRSRGVGFMLRQWLQQEAVAQRLLAAADGARRLTNLLHLAECLHQAAAEHPSPETLLRWLQAQREGGASGDDATQLRLESDRNLVQIVTIHKSKGLEYPVVFCPFLWDGRLRPADDGLEGAARHDDDGAAVIDFRGGFDPACDPEAARAEARLEAAAEFMRLVYVALTRAMHRCYLVAGSYRIKAGKHWSLRESASSGLNWLVAGDGLTPEAWSSPKRALPEPAAIDAAWRALAALAAPAALAALAESVAPAAPVPPAASSAPAPAEPAAIAVAPLPTAWRAALPAPANRSDAPQALPPPDDLGRAWWIGSYSALVHGVAGTLAGLHGSLGSPGSPGSANLSTLLTLAPTADERAAAGRSAADHDLRTEPTEAGAWPDDSALADPFDRAPQLATPALAADDFLGFPRGAVAGECVHAALEWAEFTDPGSWPDAVARALLQHPPAPRGSGSGGGGSGSKEPGNAQAQLQRLLADVLGTSLPLGTQRPLRLAELPPGRRLAELEFHLPVPQLAADDLVPLLARLGYPAPALDFRPLHGYLKGFIDLVFEHDGRFFIADWKSNHLGDSPADYGPVPMAAAMAQHHYHLQYLLYSVALHRWLQRRLPGYHYDRHVGGVAYLFVRGLRPGWHDAQGQPTGLFFHRPSAAAIGQLSALLGGEGAAP